MLLPTRLLLVLRDPLPKDTPWLGVVLARVVTILAWGLAVAIALGNC